MRYLLLFVLIIISSNAYAQNIDWTDGCIAVTNDEIEEIWKLVPNGTKITISP